MFHIYYDLYFTTATILEWKHLLKKDAMKDIIINSFRFLVQERRVTIFDFVIMPNHIHVIWQILPPYTLSEVQAALTSFTGHQFKKVLQVENPDELSKYRVDLADRKYQFWERNPLSIPILYDKIFWQKAEYVHWNPCATRWKLATQPDGYKYSSAYKSSDGGYWDFVTPFGWS